MHTSSRLSCDTWKYKEGAAQTEEVAVFENGPISAGFGTAGYLKHNRNIRYFEKVVYFEWEMLCHSSQLRFWIFKLGLEVKVRPWPPVELSWIRFTGIVPIEDGWVQQTTNNSFKTALFLSLFSMVFNCLWPNKDRPETVTSGREKCRLFLSLHKNTFQCVQLSFLAKENNNEKTMNQASAPNVYVDCHSSDRPYINSSFWVLDETRNRDCVSSTRIVGWIIIVFISIIKNHDWGAQSTSCKMWNGCPKCSGNHITTSIVQFNQSTIHISSNPVSQTPRTCRACWGVALVPVSCCNKTWRDYFRTRVKRGDWLQENWICVSRKKWKI